MLYTGQQEVYCSTNSFSSLYAPYEREKFFYVLLENHILNSVIFLNIKLEFFSQKNIWPENRGHKVGIQNMANL